VKKAITLLKKPNNAMELVSKRLVLKVERKNASRLAISKI